MEETIQEIERIIHSRMAGNDREDERALRSARNAVNSISFNKDKTTTFVHSTSNLSRDMAFAASTIDGIVQDYKRSVDRAFRSGTGIKEQSRELAKLDKFMEDIEKATQTINDLVKSQLEAGIGDRRDLYRYNRNKIEENRETIESELKTKPMEEVAKKHNIPEDMLSDITTKVALQEKKDEFVQARAEGKKSDQIAEEFGVEEKYVVNFIGLWKSEIDQAKATLKQQKQAPAAPKKESAAKKGTQTQAKKAAEQPQE